MIFQRICVKNNPYQYINKILANFYLYAFLWSLSLDILIIIDMKLRYFDVSVIKNKVLNAILGLLQYIKKVIKLYQNVVILRCSRIISHIFTPKSPKIWTVSFFFCFLVVCYLMHLTSGQIYMPKYVFRTLQN